LRGFYTCLLVCSGWPGALVRLALCCAREADLACLKERRKRPKLAQLTI